MCVTFKCVFAYKDRLQIARISRKGKKGQLRIGQVGPTFLSGKRKKTSEA